MRALLGSARLVTLTGPPGVGKTRLAIAALEVHDDVAWVDLTAVTSAAEVIDEIGRALGVRSSSPNGLAAALDGPCVVLLDNCEHLRGLAVVVAEVLAASPHLRVLATSRERLRLAVEREYAVPPLPMPSEDELDDPDRLRGNPAVSLLLERAPGGVRLTPGTSRSLAEICIGLDGLPLAIELAAARLRVFTPSELAFRLERRMSILTTSMVDVPSRHRDLRTAIAWSHGLLGGREQAVFRRLSVFSCPFTLDDAIAVAAQEDTADVVESLLEKNLLGRAPDGGESARFTLLVSLRTFAAERLAESGEEGSTRDRHAQLFAERAAGWEASLGSARETAVWVELPRTRADVQTALARARGRRPDDALLLAAVLGWEAYFQGLFTDVSFLLDVLREDGPSASAEARMAATLAAGVVAFGQGQVDRAALLLEEVRAVAGPRQAAMADAFLGHLARGRGDFDEAGSRYRAARDSAVAAGNSRGRAWADHDLALLALDRGEVEEAVPLLIEALELFERLEHTWGSAVCSWLLGSARVQSGDLDAGARLVGRSLALHRVLGDRRGLAQCLETMALVAISRGAAVSAARLVGAAGRQREVASSPPTEREARLLDEIERRTQLALGQEGAARERHAGGAMRGPAVLELAERLVAEPSASGPAALTTRQAEVADLVAEGLTNRQIGRRLGISEKTVELHVSAVLARLGLPSRAGVAVWAAAQHRVR